MGNIGNKKKSIRSTFYYLVLSMHLRDCLYQATIIENSMEISSQCRFFKCRFFSCTFCCSEIVLKKIKGRFIRKGEWVSNVLYVCVCWMKNHAFFITHNCFILSSSTKFVHCCAKIVMRGKVDLDVLLKFFQHFWLNTNQLTWKLLANKSHDDIQIHPKRHF